ncbi:SMI1/KNR4 family protein [Bacillus sp. RAR_GA_16]|uniref:SMI1/KNR4 family protein n=1 Tax=Bacillus sp. RAR_GA_16 TaxID=2876774 RepID=UPI001CCBE5DA|nr:SMI1/KNR4 family protein [Bacillus sp. RAR_GA_16]MCA0172896.1 SMI1/KNR4 family protein [Bacillus sp. RAR_GA_16]
MRSYDFLKAGEWMKVNETEVLEAEERLGFLLPNELRKLYLEVGYGFIKGLGENAINRLMDPTTIADVTLREGIYEFDPDLDGIYEEADQLVFYEVNEGVYLTLDLNSHHRSPVYYFETKLTDSLEEFMRLIDQNKHYFLNLHVSF